MRILKIVVATLGALIVVGLAVVLVTIVSRIASAPTPPETPVAAVTAPDVARLMGPDAEVVSTATDGARLALVLKRPEGLAVVVIDMRTGAVLSTVDPAGQ